MPTSEFAAIAAQAPGAALDEIARRIWQALAAGDLTEAEAVVAAEAVERRKKALSAKAGGSLTTRQVTSPAASYRRAGPISSDSLRRRRRLAGSGALPGELAAELTTGQVAVLAVIGQECARSGRGFAWPIARLAAVAGVGRTTAKAALRQAVRLGLVRVLERRRRAARSLTNVVRIESARWWRWLRRGVGSLSRPPSSTKTSRKAVQRAAEAAGEAIKALTVPPRAVAPPG